MIGIALALMLSHTPFPHAAYHRKHARPHPKTKTAKRLLANDRLTLLALRREMLRDFLIETGTESPAFTDSHVDALEQGISVGPTAVTIDFLQSPIVRATVRNTSGRTVDLLLTARLLSDGTRACEASAPIDGLKPGESRHIELYCPGVLVPKAVQWTALSL